MFLFNIHPYITLSESGLNIDGLASKQKMPQKAFLKAFAPQLIFLNRIL
jgi:hypothetical protein